MEIYCSIFQKIPSLRTLFYVDRDLCQIFASTESITNNSDTVNFCCQIPNVSSFSLLHFIKKQNTQNKTKPQGRRQKKINWRILKIPISTILYHKGDIYAFLCISAPIWSTNEHTHYVYLFLCENEQPKKITAKHKFAFLCAFFLLYCLDFFLLNEYSPNM